MIMSKMEESKRDKLLQNIQDNTDILCKLGAVIIVLLIIIAFQLFYQLLQLERYKGSDMKKFLAVLALLAVSTVSFADDRYEVFHYTNKDLLPRVTIVDTKTGNIAYCNPKDCTVNLIMGSPNFKEAFARAEEKMEEVRIKEIKTRLPKYFKQEE